MPYPGESWQPEGKAACQAHEYIRAGVVKTLTLFPPSDGQVRLSGVDSCTNEVLHAWLKEQLLSILDTLPASGKVCPCMTSAPKTLGRLSAEGCQAQWQTWREGLSVYLPLPQKLPPLRMLLVLDNLAGHKSVEFVHWLFAQGIMPLYTPLGGSWLNMAESIQRILKRRALDGQHPTDTQQIIAWFEAVARSWNRDPTPFEWAGKRAARRQRARERRHALGGSGACTRRPVRRRNIEQKWRSSLQVTH